MHSPDSCEARPSHGAAPVTRATDGRATALDNVADDIDSDDDPELVVLVERLEGYYVPETDEFVPTAVAIEIIESFEGDDATELVRDARGRRAGERWAGQQSGHG